MCHSIQGIKAILVDDWDEVCRENTDIELLHHEHGLLQETTFTLADMVCRNAFMNVDRNESIFFNPMGLAAFDIAIATSYLREAERLDIGISL
ncbi:hypothetical protein D3C76_1647180 [compost metagenome]